MMTVISFGDPPGSVSTGTATFGMCESNGHTSPLIGDPLPAPGRCPGCGRCQTCGQPVPAPAPYMQPYIVQPYIVPTIIPFIPTYPSYPIYPEGQWIVSNINHLEDGHAVVCN